MVAAVGIERVWAYRVKGGPNLAVAYLRRAHLSGRTYAASHARAVRRLVDYPEARRAARPLPRWLAVAPASHVPTSGARPGQPARSPEAGPPGS